MKQRCENRRRFRYRLPIVLQKDALLELQNCAQEHDIPIESLIIEILEDYMKGSRKTAKSVRSARKPPFPGSWPKGI
jgi:hypothetical protein